MSAQLAVRLTCNERRSTSCTPELSVVTATGDVDDARTTAYVMDGWRYDPIGDIDTCRACRCACPPWFRSPSGVAARTHNGDCPFRQNVAASAECCGDGTCGMAAWCGTYRTGGPTWRH